MCGPRRSRIVKPKRGARPSKFWQSQLGKYYVSPTGYESLITPKRMERIENAMPFITWDFGKESVPIPGWGDKPQIVFYGWWFGNNKAFTIKYRTQSPGGGPAGMTIFHNGRKVWHHSGACYRNAPLYEVVLKNLDRRVDL